MSKWGPQQSCCFLAQHHLPQFYHHWQPACKLQDWAHIKQIISVCQQIMCGSDANLFTTFIANTLKVAFVLTALTACHEVKNSVHFCVCVSLCDGGRKKELVWETYMNSPACMLIYIHVYSIQGSSPCWLAVDSLSKFSFCRGQTNKCIQPALNGQCRSVNLSVQMEFHL